MRALAIAAALACACGGTAKPAPAPPPPEPATPLPAPPPPPTPVAIAEAEKLPTCADGDDDCFVQAISGFMKAMCTCAAGDSKCAQTQVDRMQGWLAEFGKRAGDKKPRPDTIKRLEPLMRDYTDCATKAMGAAPTAP